MSTDEAIPSERVASELVARALTRAPVACRRFTTGNHHYVYEAVFRDGTSVVVRIARPSSRLAMVGAAHLSHQLRPRGVPLPRILAEDLSAETPWLLLERLPGTDLAYVMRDLPEAALDRIAAAVVHAQVITSGTGSSGRYGYAVRPDDAPYARWRDVLLANVSRSRTRIAESRLFDNALPDEVEAKIAALDDELDAIHATPFLHDTTTKNVIVTPEGQFSGIVDVDDLCFGDPRYPAALTLAAMLAYGGPQHYVASWMRQAGHADDAVFRLYVAVFLLDLMSEHGHDFNGNQSATSPDQRGALLQAFRREMDSLRP